MRLVESFPPAGGSTNHRRRWYAGHDPAVIVTNEQAHYNGHRSVAGAIPAHGPMYTWNLAGYRHGHTPSGLGNRHTFGGLGLAAFNLIPLPESSGTASWPF